jgi:hypothetical protein
MSQCPEAPAEYATSDFYLACFLKACGLKLLDAQREGRRTTFVFEDSHHRPMPSSTPSRI